MALMWGGLSGMSAYFCHRAQLQMSHLGAVCTSAHPHSTSWDRFSLHLQNETDGIMRLQEPR